MNATRRKPENNETNATRRKPENNETNAARQARLRERRKAAGFKRITLWLSPEQVDSLERLGGEPWLGTRVKQLLDNAVSAEPSAGRATRNGTAASTGKPAPTPQSHRQPGAPRKNRGEPASGDPSSDRTLVARRERRAKRALSPPEGSRDFRCR